MTDEVRPLDDDQALDWLRDRGLVETSIADLARAWHWTRSSSYRRLDKWKDEGRITKTGAAGGRWVLSAIADKADIKQYQELVADPPGGVWTSVRTVATRPDRAVVLPAVLIVTALGLGATGLVVNASFAASFGQTRDAALLLAAIGVALDLLAIVLPATAAQLWNRGRRLFALVAWTLWPAVLVMTLLAATGFAAGNLGDAIAGRERDAVAAVNLRTELDRARAERATIAEARSVGEIEAAIARTRVPDWARPCVAPDTAESRRACDPVMKLRQALETSRRRGVLDSQIRDAEALLAALPAVGLADPVAFAAEIITWASAGRLSPTAADVYRIRIIGLVIAPSGAGLIIMLGLAVGARRVTAAIHNRMAAGGPGWEPTTGANRSEDDRAQEGNRGGGHDGPR